ncbi:hypothetical protein GCM10010129_05270 [Streptomyces fumigatiscleroticus]|nr:hypothetical protein GCM10010129_05270 [Streptomyces fumigatiscleroticus]
MAVAPPSASETHPRSAAYPLGGGRYVPGGPEAACFRTAGAGNPARGVGHLRPRAHGTGLPTPT